MSSHSLTSRGTEEGAKLTFYYEGACYENASRNVGRKYPLTVENFLEKIKDVNDSAFISSVLNL